MYITETDKLKKFICLRNRYIDLLEHGKISKAEFNNMNNEIFQKINLRPFQVLDSFNKALYNYNYYNAKAKMYLDDCNKYKQLKDKRSIKRAKIAENNKANNYYHKDESIIAMINLEKSKNIEAYYIKLQSKTLSKQIFEIYFKEKYRVILHTKNNIVKQLLINKGIFSNEEKKSLIESYVNS